MISRHKNIVRAFKPLEQGPASAEYTKHLKLQLKFLFKIFKIGIWMAEDFFRHSAFFANCSLVGSPYKFDDIS